MGRADRPGRAPSARGGGGRLSKNQRRIVTVLAHIPAARDQLLAAMEDVGPAFELDALIAAAESDDPRERNRVAVIERQVDVLVNWLEELAARALDEGVRRGAVERTQGQPWERLTGLGVMSAATAARLREAKDTRNDLDHAYPPQSWRALHDAANVVVDELDDHLTRFRGWAVQSGILPRAG
ncbi:MAG: hypothetical protein ACRDPC_20685 [Solirubrobacteraceae bacterium]